MKKTILILLGFLPLLITAQDTTQPVRHPGRVWLGIGSSVVGYGGSLVALSNVWYKHYPQTSFHFYNDNNDWLQMDKAGHFYSAYTAGKFTMEAWRWAGLPRKQRIWIGGLSGAAFLTVIEILDGFSQGWGFSPGDMFANLTGSAAFISQELLWDEQRIGIKFSFHLQSYGDPQLNQRARQLFGNRSLEKLFKDYNAQTYWISMNLKSFWRKSNLPRWLNVAIGYGADGMFGGSRNIGKDVNGNVFFDRTDIHRYRQWYLAPDIDLTRIPTKKKWLKTSLFLLNALKFPTPSVGFSGKGIEWNWIHF